MRFGLWINFINRHGNKSGLIEWGMKIWMKAKERFRTRGSANLHRCMEISEISHPNYAISHVLLICFDQLLGIIESCIVL